MLKHQKENTNSLGVNHIVTVEEEPLRPYARKVDKGRFLKELKIIPTCSACMRKHNETPCKNLSKCIYRC